MREIMEEVKRRLPKFNDNTLIDLRKNEMGNLIEFIVERLREALTVIKRVELVEYRIVPPHDRILNDIANHRIKRSVDIMTNEAALVQFVFRLEDGEIIDDKYLYVPYMHENGFLVYNGTTNTCRR